MSISFFVDGRELRPLREFFLKTDVTTGLELKLHDYDLHLYQQLYLLFSQSSSKFLNGEFSLTRPASMQIYWNKGMCLGKKRVQLPLTGFGTATWPPFQFGTPL